MSVKGCFTDFHIDFGGTSVWYHVFKGGKVRPDACMPSCHASFDVDLLLLIKFACVCMCVTLFS